MVLYLVMIGGLMASEGHALARWFDSEPGDPPSRQSNCPIALADSLRPGASRALFQRALTANLACKERGVRNLVQAWRELPARADDLVLLRRVTVSMRDQRVLAAVSGVFKDATARRQVRAEALATVFSLIDSTRTVDFGNLDAAVIPYISRQIGFGMVDHPSARYGDRPLRQVDRAQAVEVIRSVAESDSDPVIRGISSAVLRELARRKDKRS